MKLTARDRIRIELTVRRVDWALDGRVPMGKRRQLRNELRANLYSAATEVGSQKAVQQLGALQGLATAYLDLYRGRFDFRAGTWAVVAVYAALQVLALAVFIAFSSGVIAGGGHAASYSLWSGFGPFGGGVLNGSGFELLVLSPAHILLMAIAFAVGSSYRLVLRR
ncbi:MAG: hypothetical protein ABI334_06740 [Candidatus Dormiibacterota bacterium]